MGSSHLIPLQTVERQLRLKTQPKGRQADPDSLAAVRKLLGQLPRRRDLLIEHLHKIQDAFGHLSDRHLVALAKEMNLAMAEVYEVASFYHHFDIVKDGADAPHRHGAGVRFAVLRNGGRAGFVEALASGAGRWRARAGSTLYRPL